MALETKIVEFAAPHVVTGVKYLFHVVKNWWNGRKGNKKIQNVETKIESLKKELEALVPQLETKGRDGKIDEEDVKKANKQLTEVKNLENVINDDVTSEQAFYAWLSAGVNDETFRADMDVVEVGELYQSKLAKFIVKALTGKPYKQRIDKYQDLLSDIVVNIKSLNDSRERKRRTPGYTVIADEIISQKELSLWYCIHDAEELMRKA
ncbi:MAG: hypothetical protein JSW14_05165 [Candidatus Bathyarchaeum sp.]|nr:MAG: hypothetical protein JSW14_05165 [Candidatus Bathyarchaeum sp.]